MNTLIMIGQLLLGLSILVTIHEFGHFWAARMFGIKVEKFYLFFDAWNVKLFSFKKGDTEYGIGWLPFGGYVKIAGMIDESLDTEAMKQEPQPWEFRSKPAWQRLIVMLGGIIMNLVLGAILYIMMVFVYGDSYTPNNELKYGILPLTLGKEIGLVEGDQLVAVNGNKIDKFEDLYSTDLIMGDRSVITVSRNDSIKDIHLPSDFTNLYVNHKGDFVIYRQTFYVKQIASNSNAEKAGLMANDSIAAINDTAFRYFHEFQQLLRNNAGKTVTLTVYRNGKSMPLPIEVTKMGTLGFEPDTHDFERKTEYYSLGKSIPLGLSRAVETIVNQVKGFGILFSGKVDPGKAVQGPIGIMKLYGTEWIWSKFWALTALLSLVLAFMNLLPIPALDGGHVVFLLAEMISGRKLGDRFMQTVQVIGMILVIGLMILIFGNDIFQNFLNK